LDTTPYDRAAAQVIAAGHALTPILTALHGPVSAGGILADQRASW
jgi:hypothetical protein